jgi:hypothetical protein
MECMSIACCIWLVAHDEIEDGEDSLHPSNLNNAAFVSDILYMLAINIDRRRGLKGSVRFPVRVSFSGTRKICERCKDSTSMYGALLYPS